MKISRMMITMKFIHFLLYFTVFTLFKSSAQDLKRFSFSEPAMGTVFNIIFYATDSLMAREISEVAFKKVKTLNSVFSDYDPNSELNRLCNSYELNKPVKLSVELFDILYQSKKISQLTDGAFDVTIGPYTILWRKAKTENKLPSKKELTEAKNKVGHHNFSLNIKRKTIIFKKPGMRIDLGGIAKGYTADQVLEIIEKNGIKHALLDFGGDIVFSNPPPNKKGWNVEVGTKNHSEKQISEIISLSNIAIATSGNYYQKLSIGGKTYSHIIDPLTGLGLTITSQVTVIAASGMLADSYASAFSVMPKNKIDKLLKKNKDLHLAITILKDKEAETWYSDRFKTFKVEN